MVNQAALYLRLSREDKMQDESNSITNQRILLTQYAKEHHISIAAEFVDDGISGTKWERTGLQDLLLAAEDGWIDTVLIKDLSRLSRDYIRTGELLEYWFPSHGIRLISVTDRIDTLYDTSDKYLSLRAVIDDWYARDISYKVRAAIHARQSEGICTLPRMPYGYEKRGNGICIDPEKAKVIERIYQTFLQGESACKIAKTLTNEDITPPNESSKHWNDNSVRRILQNPAYIGHLHIHTTERISYKCSKRGYIPQNSHIILPIPSIIEKEVFEQAAKRLHANRHQKTAKHWLAGHVRCGACASAMILQSEKGDYRIFCSGRRKKTGCTNRSVLWKTLLPLIQDAMLENGFPAEISVIRKAVETVFVSNDTVKIRLRYQKPTETERGMLLNLCAKQDSCVFMGKIAK